MPYFKSIVLSKRVGAVEQSLHFPREKFAMASPGRQKIANEDDPWKVSAVVSALMELLLSVLLLLGAGIAFMTSLLMNYFDLEPPCSYIGCSHILLPESRNKPHTDRAKKQIGYEQCRPSWGYAKQHIDKFPHAQEDAEVSFVPEGDDFSSNISRTSASDVDVPHLDEDTYVSSEVQLIKNRSSVSSIHNYKKFIHVKRRASNSDGNTSQLINEDRVPLCPKRSLSAWARKSNDGDYCEMPATSTGKLRMPNACQGKLLQRETSTDDVPSLHSGSDEHRYMLLDDDTFFDSFEIASGCENVSTLEVDDNNNFEAGEVHSESIHCDIKAIPEKGPSLIIESAEASILCKLSEECEECTCITNSCEGEHPYVLLEGNNEALFVKELRLESTQPLLNTVSDDELEVPSLLNMAFNMGLLANSSHRPANIEQLTENNSYHKLAEVGIQTIALEEQQHGYILLRNDDEGSSEAPDSENMLSDRKQPLLQVQEGKSEAPSYAKLAAKRGNSHCGDPKQLAEVSLQCESLEDNGLGTYPKGFEMLAPTHITEALSQGFSSDRGSGCLGPPSCNLAMVEDCNLRDNCLNFEDLSVPLSDLEIVRGLRKGQKNNAEEPLIDIEVCCTAFGDLLGAESLEEIKSSDCESQIAVTGEALLSEIFGMDLHNHGSLLEEDLSFKAFTGFFISELEKLSVTSDKVQPGFQQAVAESKSYDKDSVSHVCSSNATMLQDVFLFQTQGQVDKLELSSLVCFANDGAKREFVAADGCSIQDNNTTESGNTDTSKITLEALFEMVTEDTGVKHLLDKSTEGAANVQNGENALDSQLAQQDKEDFQVGKDKEEGMDVLRQALWAEKNMLAALETELENERNAAAIATSEAMAMISRLQEEKSAMQLEVAQLQRMAEEKAEYDEYAMALLKEILFKREAEKHALEKEVELYREKLSAEKVKETENKRSSMCSSTSLLFLSRMDEDQGPFSSERHDSRLNSLPSLDEFYKAENTYPPCSSKGQNMICEKSTEPSAHFSEARSLKGLHLNNHFDTSMADDRGRSTSPLIERLGPSRSIFSSNDEETQFILERLWVLEEELRELRGVDGLGAPKKPYEVQYLDCSSMSKKNAVNDLSSCQGRAAGGHANEIGVGACLPVHDVYEVHSASSRRDQNSKGGISVQDIEDLEDLKSSPLNIMHEEQLAGTMCCYKSQVFTHTGRVSPLNESQCDIPILANHAVPYADNAHAQLSKTTEGRLVSTDVLQQLAVRLQVLETDRELLREILESFRHKDTEFKLFQEIAQQLRELQMAGFSSISTGAARQDPMPVTFGKSCTRALKKRRYCSELGQAEVNLLHQRSI